MAAGRATPRRRGAESTLEQVLAEERERRLHVERDLTVLEGRRAPGPDTGAVSI
jgi:hypothetical protein